MKIFQRLTAWSNLDDLCASRESCDEHLLQVRLAEHLGDDEARAIGELDRVAHFSRSDV